MQAEPTTARMEEAKMNSDNQDPTGNMTSPKLVGQSDDKKVLANCNNTTQSPDSSKLKHATVEEEVKDDDGEHENPTVAQAGKPAAVEASETVEKKKKKKKPKAKPSGFEEYYVDVPLTTDQHAEEQKLYDTSKPLTERLQIAIQRYNARRKFDSFRRLVFDKYMAYGRVRSGPNPFTGGVDDKNPNHDAADIAQMQARHYFEDNALETSYVDFDAVARGFLSSYLPQVLDLYEHERIGQAVGVVQNFINYLVHHDVVPEYESQLFAAKRTCDLAEGQLWLCCQLSPRLPGKFNEACSVLWGGFYQETYPEDMEHAKKMDVAPLVTLDDAKKIFIAGIAAQASQGTMDAYSKQMANKTYHIKRQFEGFFEVTEIIKASDDVKSMYKHAIAGGFPRVGKIKARAWYNPGAAPEDLTKKEKMEIENSGRPIEFYEFIVEDELLLKMFPGIKIQAKIYETSFGLFYFDSITAVLCSFYTYLLNEDLVDWKPHRFLPQRETIEPDSGAVEAKIVGEEPAQMPESVTALYGNRNDGFFNSEEAPQEVTT